VSKPTNSQPGSRPR